MVGQICADMAVVICPIVSPVMMAESSRAAAKVSAEGSCAPTGAARQHASIIVPTSRLIRASARSIEMKFVELPVLADDAANRARHRAHYNRVGLDHRFAEFDAAKHCARGHAGRREQAVAANHVLDL